MNKYKLNIKLLLISCFFIATTGCNNYLELESLEKVSPDQLVESEGGIKALLAGIYSTIPMEDFTYRPNAIDEVSINDKAITKMVGAYNRHGWAGVDYMIATSFYTDESSRSDGAQGIGPIQNSERHWTYEWIREINLFFENIEKAQNGGVINESEYNRLKSEAHFIRAYAYFGLVKRFGGIPLIDCALDDEFVPGGSNDVLYIPRSTEKATWEFVLKECDLAIEHLPEVVSDSDGKYRASKWAAYGLKSRAALHAASVAKYWNRAPLAGEAVSQQLVGMTAADAGFFYEECLKASKAIIDQSGKSLYMPTPADPKDAAKNYQNLFLNDNEEIIFRKAYLDGTTVADQGHNFDIWFSPSQANPGYHKFGRYNPTLDIVDLYEDYTDDGTGKSTKIITRTDGKEDESVADPKALNVNLPFRKYDDLYEPFKDKDARLLASIIVPGAIYKNTSIIIQGGMIKKDGSVVAYADGNEIGKDGNMYYSFGGESTGSFSGFYGMGRSDDANFTATGFTIRKYLQEFKNIQGTEQSSTTSWIDMRLAEIYLNYAEAAIESGSGDQTLAATYLNALRRRAGHTDQIPATLENILKERRIELAFEGFRYWDLIRRREYHTTFNSTRRLALVPMIDLREEKPKYIFVRANFYYDEYAGGRTFQPYRYYMSIPGRNTNNLVQNPQY